MSNEASKSATMPPENAELVRTLWAALDRDGETPWPPASNDELDRQLRLDLIDERVEIRNPAEFPVADDYHGHDGVRQWATEVWEVFSELHLEVEEILEAADGETVVSVQRTQGRMRHTNLETDLRWAAVWTIQDGKAVSAHGYMTRREAVEAAGLNR
jgi:ketosteroid isomerase-like protein